MVELLIWTRVQDFLKLFMKTMKFVNLILLEDTENADLQIILKFSFSTVISKNNNSNILLYYV